MKEQLMFSQESLENFQVFNILGYIPTFRNQSVALKVLNLLDEIFTRTYDEASCLNPDLWDDELKHKYNSSYPINTKDLEELLQTFFTFLARNMFNGINDRFILRPRREKAIKNNSFFTLGDIKIYKYSDYQDMMSRIEYNRRAISNIYIGLYEWECLVKYYYEQRKPDYVEKIKCINILIDPFQYITSSENKINFLFSEEFHSRLFSNLLSLCTNGYCNDFECKTFIDDNFFEEVEIPLPQTSSMPPVTTVTTTTTTTTS